MKKIFLFLALAGLAAAPAFASDQADVMAAVQRFVEGFNKGDMKMMTSACADEVSIIDEFPPHEWHGKGSCRKWSKDYDADAKKNGITDGVVTLGKPSHVDVSGDRAYVVGPANYAYKTKGKAAGEVGSIFTIALRKGATGWCIIGWAWARH
jgi:ketosteroid isomerase-like protein